MDSKRKNAKIKQKIGLGAVFPWIFEPSQSKRVGQNTSMINGVPEPVRYKKLEDSMVKILAIIATLFLNQRFNRTISSIPSSKPIIMLGSFIA